MLFSYLILLALVSNPILTVLPPDDSSCTNRCFHQPPESCPPITNYCRCRWLPNCNNAAICCNVNEFTLTEGLACANISSTEAIKALHIRNATFEAFNWTVHQKVWKRLMFMSITDGHINKVEGMLSKSTKILCLNLSSNHINSIQERTLAQFINLSFLDLSNNNLTAVPSTRLDWNITLDVSNNTNMTCSNLKETLGKDKITFVNEDKTYCSTSKDLSWFQTMVVLPLAEIRKVHELHTNCLVNCTCGIYRLSIPRGKEPYYEIAVNCSSKNYFSLPKSLPKSTILLDVSNNNISSIKELREPSYEDLRVFIADNNQISSIQPLEGTNFINQFDTLSLQRNRIKMLEMYVLDKIQFERNINQRQVKLGFNKLQCDCNTKKLQTWLLSKLSHIPDHDDIRCDNLNIRVTELESSKLCQSPQDWTDYIYYIISVEVVLLVGLILKVSYDYWVFKTAGYLPWPASKMPRLPCDWLCEYI